MGMLLDGLHGFAVLACNPLSEWCPGSGDNRLRTNDANDRPVRFARLDHARAEQSARAGG